MQSAEQCRRHILLAAFALGTTAWLPAQQAPEPSYTLRTGTQLVIVDVVVNDAKGNPVSGLKKSDFTILENNKPQAISSFEAHVPASAQQTANTPATPTLPRGYFTNFSPAQDHTALNVLLLDSLNTPLVDQSFARDQLRQFLKKSPSSTRIAVFGLTTHLILLQGFTSDPELLRVAIEKKPGSASPLLDDPTGSGISASQLSDTLSSMGSTPDMEMVLANVQDFEAKQQAFKLQLREQYTLDAINQLCRYLAGIPGRKNLIWFSGSFPLNLMPQGTSGDPFGSASLSADEFRETTNLLTLARVAVYPVDSRGLTSSSAFSAANTGGNYARRPDQMQADYSNSLQQTDEEHNTMRQMAAASGGRAFVDTNGLSQAVAKVVGAGSNYYTLAYSPSETKGDGTFRQIQVKLPAGDYNLEFRHGYYAAESSAKAGTATQPAQVEADLAPSARTMAAAMMRGGPDPTQITMKVRVLPAIAQTEDKLATNNVLNPDAKVAGPYHRYSVDILADPSMIRFVPTPDGHHLSALQFETYVYSDKGQLIDIVDDRAHAKLTADAYTQMLRRGVMWHQEVSVPAKGEFYFRIGIHDLTTNFVGAVELPVSSVSSLPPSNTPGVK
jgi:VWFA-related protein